MTRNVQHSSMTRLLLHLLIWSLQVIEDTPAKSGEYSSDITQFSRDRAGVRKIYLDVNKHSSLHLT